MVKTWAEKEFRNLSRLRASGVPCPQPLVLKAHIVVMEFCGEDGWPAPRLKDVSVTPDQARGLYLDCVLIMRRMFHDCKLVHGDLSEYNLL
jgi:RIO kinase 1